VHKARMLARLAHRLQRPADICRHAEVESDRLSLYRRQLVVLRTNEERELIIKSI
jgi:hypothetical protein